MNTNIITASGATGEANAKVSVAVRVRPLIERESNIERDKDGDVGSSDSQINWLVDGNIIQQISPNGDEKNPSPLSYSFDHVFSMVQSTKEVYSRVVSPIVDQAFSGFNGTILCYGQTSSGKTFTLYGNEQEEGILSLTAQHLFRRIQNDKERTYIVRLGLIEIYNEKVTDLLSESPQKEVQINEVNGSVVPKDLDEISILKPEDMLGAMQLVQKKRRVGETRLNQESSRSHTILRIVMESVPLVDDGDENIKLTVTTAVLNFVDLAGSQKQSQTGAVGERFKEATYINRSLSALSHVVTKLSQTESTTGNLPPVGSTSSQSDIKGANFVNYRDSELTRLLQSSLSGNAYIAMICTVTPASVDETTSTLKFARTAKQIQTTPKANHQLATGPQYQQKIKELLQNLERNTIETDDLTDVGTATNLESRPVLCHATTQTSLVTKEFGVGTPTVTLSDVGTATELESKPKMCHATTETSLLTKESGVGTSVVTSTDVGTGTELELMSRPVLLEGPTPIQMKETGTSTRVTIVNRESQTDADADYDGILLANREIRIQSKTYRAKLEAARKELKNIAAAENKKIRDWENKLVLKDAEIKDLREKIIFMEKAQMEPKPKAVKKSKRGKPITGEVRSPEVNSYQAFYNLNPMLLWSPEPRIPDDENVVVNGKPS